MNANQIINITIVLSLIAIFIIKDKLSRLRKERLYDNISNKINSSSASNEEIKLAYKYETGKSPFYTNRKEGTKLEYKVFKSLYRYEGKVLSNLHTNWKNGKSSESDIVFIHNTGIYVIECKDTQAQKIIGDEHDTDWKFIFNSKYSENRYNPLKQNIGHIKSLDNVLIDKYSNNSYVSIILITCNDVKISYTSNSNNYYQKIINLHELKKYITTLINKRNRIFSDEEVMEIYKYLHENYANPTSKQKREHIDGIQSKYYR